GEEPAVRRPIGRELRTLAVHNGLERTPVQRLPHQAHTAFITPAEQELPAIGRPCGEELRPGYAEFGETRYRAISRKIHQPDGSRGGGRIIVGPKRQVSFVRRKIE